MTKNTILAALLVCLAALPPALAPLPAAAQERYTITPVQTQERGSRPSIFRFLFGPRRQQRDLEAAPPPRKASPDQRQTRGAVQPAAKKKPRRQKPAEQQSAARAAPTVAKAAAVAKDADARRILVIGDFIAKALANGLTEAFAEDPKIVVVDATNGSSGLVRSDFFDWPAELPGIIEAEKPDAVVAMIGMNDRQTIRGEAGAVVTGTEKWIEAYRSRVAALAAALAASGKPAFWVGLLPVRQTAMSRDYSVFNGLYREALETTPVRFVDAWNAFANEEGTFVAVGPDVSGQEVQLRSGDGLNLTKAGQRKLAFFLERDLTRLLEGSAAQLAALPGAAAPGAAAAPAVGPMLPIDAVPAGAGEALSSAAAGSDSRAGALVVERLGGSAAPAGRADNFVWPRTR